jgi:hypothetical protein
MCLRVIYYMRVRVRVRVRLASARLRGYALCPDVLLLSRCPLVVVRLLDCFLSLSLSPSLFDSLLTQAAGTRVE